MRPPDYYYRFKHKLRELLLPPGYSTLKPPSTTPHSPAPRAAAGAGGSALRAVAGDRLPQPQAGKPTAMVIPVSIGVHSAGDSLDLSAPPLAPPRRLREDNFTDIEEDEDGSPRLTGMPLQEL